jgi:hypothetical protein
MVSGEKLIDGFGRTVILIAFEESVQPLPLASTQVTLSPFIRELVISESPWPASSPFIFHVREVRLVFAIKMSVSPWQIVLVCAPMLRESAGLRICTTILLEVSVCPASQGSVSVIIQHTVSPSDNWFEVKFGPVVPTVDEFTIQRYKGPWKSIGVLAVNVTESLLQTVLTEAVI